MIKKYIKGNAKRGELVIKILKDMGGKNDSNLKGNREDSFYFIDPDNKINHLPIYADSLAVKVILECFEEITLPEVKERYDPNMLKTFDRVLVQWYNDCDKPAWEISLFSSYSEWGFKCIDGVYDRCIPYNDDTMYLVGTTNEAPEYYRWWE